MKQFILKVKTLALPLLLISVVTNVSIAATENQTLAEEVLALSGLKIQLSQIPDAITQGFDASIASGELDGQFPPNVLPTVRAGLVAAFDPDALQDIMIDTLDEHLGADDLAKLVDWYSSSIGTLVATTEQERSLLTNSSLRDEYVRRLYSNPPPDSRVSALKQLEAAWKVTEASVNMMIDMQVAVSAAVVSLLPKENQLPLSVLIDTYEAQRKNLHEHYAMETMISMLYIYDPLPDSVILEYAEFMTTQLGVRYRQAANLALHKAMLEGSYKLGQNIGGLIDNGAVRHTL